MVDYALAVRLKAAAMGLPFLPMRSLLGSAPLSQKCGPRVRLSVLRANAWQPSPLFIRTWPPFTFMRRDRFGNCRIEGTTVADLDLARRQTPHHHVRAADPQRRNTPPLTRTCIPFSCRCPSAVPFGSRATCRTILSPTKTICGNGWRSRRRGHVPRVSRSVHFWSQELHRIPGPLRHRRLQELRQRELLPNHLGRRKQ